MTTHDLFITSLWPLLCPYEHQRPCTESAPSPASPRSGLRLLTSLKLKVPRCWSSSTSDPGSATSAFTLAINAYLSFFRKKSFMGSTNNTPFHLFHSQSTHLTSPPRPLLPPLHSLHLLPPYQFRPPPVPDYSWYTPFKMTGSRFGGRSVSGLRGQYQLVETIQGPLSSFFSDVPTLCPLSMYFCRYLPSAFLSYGAPPFRRRAGPVPTSFLRRRVKFFPFGAPFSRRRAGPVKFLGTLSLHRPPRLNAALKTNYFNNIVKSFFNDSL